MPEMATSNFWSLTPDLPNKTLKAIALPIVPAFTQFQVFFNIFIVTILNHTSDKTFYANYRNQ
jgi:hypothetical protein